MAHSQPMETQPAETQPAEARLVALRPAAPPPATGTIGRAAQFVFRTVVCVITFLVVFSLCEGVKDLLLG